MRKKLLFYYKVERNKGYLVGDKQRYQNIAFESGYWKEIIDKELKEKWLYLRSEWYGLPSLEWKKQFNDLLELINQKVSQWYVKHDAGKAVANIKQKNFYLNFNHDGIDCFISRWNWK